MPEHTPTPWTYGSRYVAKKADDSSYLHIAMTPENEDGKNVSGSQWEADAAFIVKAVNAHDELAQKLQNCIHALTFCIDGWDEADPYIQKLRVTRDGAQKALDALAKAEAA